MTSSVLVIGDALLDVRVAPAEAIRPGSDVPARIELMPGGQGANLAVRLARRGVPVTLVTALGEDPAGAVVRDALADDGVELWPVVADRTGAVVVVVDDRGERTMLSQRIAFAHLVDPSELPAAPWVAVSGYLLHEPHAEQLAGALAAAYGRRLLLGSAVPDEQLPAWRRAAAALRPDLLLANREEAVRLAPPGLSGLGVTDAAGATLTLGGVTVSSVTPVGAPARDTTGAGDAFAAALLAGLLDEAWPPSREAMQDAVEAGVALGSFVARVVGAQARVASEPKGKVPA